jgi:hypothetical protein
VGLPLPPGQCLPLLKRRHSLAIRAPAAHRGRGFLLFTMLAVSVKSTARLNGMAHRERPRVLIEPFRFENPVARAVGSLLAVRNSPL